MSIGIEGSHAEIHHVRTLKTIGHFGKPWLFCIFILILPICSTDIPLKWVPSYCRCSVQISSCLWLRRTTCLKESNGLTGLFFFFFFSLKNNYFFHLNKKSFLNNLQNIELLSFTIKAHLKDQYSTGTNLSLPTSSIQVFQSWIPPPLHVCSHTSPEQRQAFDRSLITTSSLHSSPPWSTHSLLHAAPLPSCF